MPATAQSSAEATASAGLAVVGSPAGARTEVSDERALPCVGSVWRDAYEVLEELRSAPTERWWRARNGRGAEVVLRAYQPADSPLREQVWSKLAGIDSPHLQRAIESFVIGGWRVEAAAAVAGVALSAWRRGRSAVDPATLKTIVAQIAEALGALHAFELVHLGLHADVVFIQEQAGAPHCVVAGFDTLTTCERERVPAPVNPFYAPPEALGLQTHAGGSRLYAWDWWSLGRVVQEVILGRSVVAQLAPAGSSESQHRAAAEALLQESDPLGSRAGAVERMADLDPNLELLLRGLLASSSDARWTGDHVDRWIRGLPVQELYLAPRHASHLQRDGHPYTVSQFAALLQSAEHWAENATELFEPAAPGTLANFLQSAPSQSAFLAQWTAALELADLPPLKTASTRAQREVITLFALLQLSGGKLIWRGGEFEFATVLAIVAEFGHVDGVAIVRGLLARSTALQIERHDAVAGRLLTEIGRTVSDAEAILKRCGWLTGGDSEGIARVFHLAVESQAALRLARDELAKRYAGSDHPAMAKLWKAPTLGRAEMVVLAWTAAKSDGCKFFSHDEVSRRRAQTLGARGNELVAILTWSRFGAALKTGAILFGDGVWAIATWLLVAGVVAVLWPGWLGLVRAAAVLALAFALRLLGTAIHRRALQSAVAGATWSWRDGSARARREFVAAGAGASSGLLEAELRNVRKDLEAIASGSPPDVRVPPLPEFRAVRAGGMLAWLLLATIAGAAGWREYRQPLSKAEWHAAWAPRHLPQNEKATAPVFVSRDADGADVKISWPYKSSDDATIVTVDSTTPATGAQIDYARQHGREIVKPYRPETITSPIILPVPGGNAATVMIFDGKRGDLYNSQVYVLPYHPIPRSLIEIGGRRGIYLDQ